MIPEEAHHAFGKEFALLSSSLLTDLEDAIKGKEQSKEPYQGCHCHYEILVHSDFAQTGN